ncbi:hypothetical protein MAL1_00020 [Bacteriophage DSS3_MAL1]|nr:hypothetical protein MAL1_00020 [Bacteriophage DSS3_MAL1]
MAKKPFDLSSMTREELFALQKQVDSAQRKYLIQELHELEHRGNELRIQLGLKKRPLSKV